jgi:alkylation response protein AidB-like acyl-CoA dehydrogenase
MTEATTGELAELSEYRQQAREWLAANVDRRDPSLSPLRGVDHKTVDGIALERAKQRRLFDAGYAGISWPAEFGGQGLTTAHERIFAEESADFALPDFGVAGGTTFRVCARTMLGHAAPAFLSGSSTARRSGRVARTTPTGACVSPGPTGTYPSTAG